MGDELKNNATMDTSVPVSAHGRNSSYFGTLAGILRIIIILVGLTAIILASIGSPNDLSSKDPGESEDSYYGYGLGYSYEALNVIYLVFLITAWLFGLTYAIILEFTKFRDKHRRANRFLYLIFGILLLIGLICGSVGTYYFWSGCCRVYPPVPGDLSGGKFIVYQKTKEEGYQNWCRCTLTKSYGNNHMETFVWNEVQVGQEITNAWAHHLTAHICSLVFAFVDVILYFLAVCFA